MAEQTQEQVNQSQAGGGYGYASDEVKVSPFNFGLNAGNAFLTKFEWIPNGGKEGAEQEALDIVFTINGTEKSYRVFPIVKAFDKNNNEVTDPNAPEFKEAITDLNARITHILHAFIDSDTIRAAFSKPIKNFKEFAQTAMSVLPTNYKEIPLDIFLQFQWQIDEGQDKTFLDIPKKMKYGKWLSPAQPGTWTEQKVANPSDSVREALFYMNEKGEKHPFVKNGWFMNSNFASQQKSGSAASSDNSAAAANMQGGTDAAAKASAW